MYYPKPLNEEEKRECFSLLQLIVSDFLAAHKQPVTFTPQNRMDLCSLLNRMTVWANEYPNCNGVKDILRREISVYCHETIQMLMDKRSNKEYILCFTYYLENYLTSINNIADAMFPRTDARPIYSKGPDRRKCQENQEIEHLLEEMFCNFVLKPQQNRLSSILLSENKPSLDNSILNLSKLLMQLKNMEVMESGAQSKKMTSEQEEEMEEDNQLKRMRCEEVGEMEEDIQSKRMRMDTE